VCGADPIVFQQRRFGLQDDTIVAVVPLAMWVIDGAQWNWNNHGYYNMQFGEQDLEQEILGLMRRSPKVLGIAATFGDKSIAAQKNLHAAMSVFDTVEQPQG